MAARYSELDSGRFGRRIYRGVFEDPTTARNTIDSARREGAEMLIARCPVSVLSVARELERVGFLLMDTLVYYIGSTARFVDQQALPGVRIRPFEKSDGPALEAVAKAAFTNYDGHYHADERLDGQAATDGYVDRFVRATHDPTMLVWSACLEQRPVGFLTLRPGQGDQTAEIDLNAVDPNVQRRGIYSGLFNAAGAAARERGNANITVSTNISNVPSQKVWVRHGLEPLRAFHTFHGWFDALKSHG